MKKPLETKEKVIITPRPPRCANPDMVPIEAEAAPAPAAAPDVAAPVEPGVAPMNNVVQGPAAGLAGVPAEEEPAQEG